MKTTQPPAAGADARALKVALPFAEEFGNAWLEGSVSAKAALIGVMTRAMLAFASQEAAHVGEHTAGPVE